ncbi:MAG: hypothetical protein PXY39_07735 [archaeon]|nr:hypothetical protein [archaeon]
MIPPRSSSLVIKADSQGRYWLEIEIADISLQAVIDTGLIGVTAPSVMLTKDTWAKVENSLDSIQQFQGIDSQGNKWLIKHAVSKVRVPTLGLEFEERIGAPAVVNTVGSLFLSKFDSYEVVINCTQKVMTISPSRER